MEKVFLIQSNPSDWESSPVVIGFTTSEEEAKKVVEKRKEEYHKARSLNDKIHEAYRNFEKENASPLMRENLVEIPKWPAGLGKDQITEEMRKERAELMAKNQEIIEQNSKLYAEWQAKQLEFVKPIFEPFLNEKWFKKWFKITDRTISCDAWGFVKDNEYSYEECNKINDGTQEKK